MQRIRRVIPDIIDLAILKYVHLRYSQREIAREVGRAVSTVNDRMKDMVDADLLIAPVVPKASRSYKISSLGTELYNKNLGELP